MTRKPPSGHCQMRRASQAETIRPFRIIPHEFSTANCLMTPSLKLRRARDRAGVSGRHGRSMHCRAKTCAVQTPWFSPTQLLVDRRLPGPGVLLCAEPAQCWDASGSRVISAAMKGRLSPPTRHWEIRGDVSAGAPPAPKVCPAGPRRLSRTTRRAAPTRRTGDLDEGAPRCRRAERDSGAWLRSALHGGVLDRLDGRCGHDRYLPRTSSHARAGWCGWRRRAGLAVSGRGWRRRRNRRGRILRADAAWPAVPNSARPQHR